MSASHSSTQETTGLRSLLTRRQARSHDKASPPASSDDTDHAPEKKRRRTPLYHTALRTLRKLARYGVEDVLPAEPPKQRDRDTTIPMIEMPAHALRDSLLHSKSGFSNYRGLFNLSLIALFVAGGRIAFDNLSKYGILISPVDWGRALLGPGWHTCALLFLLVNMFACMSLYLEKVAARQSRSLRIFDWLHVLNIAACLVVPTAGVLVTHPAPFLSFLLMFEVAIYCMKMTSYMMVNRHYRIFHYFGDTQPVNQRELNSTISFSQSQSSESNPSASTASSEAEEDTVNYPNNLTLGNLYYFILAPTLCYELNYPRSPSIRYRFLMRRILEVVFLLVVVVALFQQWMIPTVRNTFAAAEGGPESLPLAYLIDRTMKLALPNNLLWLCLFYMYFHSFLNAVGEVLRFGDRQFYRDWWNATSVTYFWKNWNIPVHKFLLRHMYRPLTSNGWSKTKAQLAVFVLSAVLHELLVSVPLGMFRLWAFMGMLAQVPLALFTDKYLQGTQYGNVVVWASLFFGQPLAIMLYVQAYITMATQNGQQILPTGAEA